RPLAATQSRRHAARHRTALGSVRALAQQREHPTRERRRRRARRGLRAPRRHPLSPELRPRHRARPPGGAGAFPPPAGIRSPLSSDLGIVLGTSEVTVLELTTAYATFARGGRFAAPRFVRRVLDRSGAVWLDGLALCGESPAPAAAGVSAVDAYLVTHLLREAVQAS